MEFSKVIDGYGRVHIPKEYRRQLKLREDDTVTISLDGNKILIEKAAPPKEKINTENQKIFTNLSATELFNLTVQLILILNQKSEE